jgi:hypothetical protein
MYNKKLNFKKCHQMKITSTRTLGMTSKKIVFIKRSMPGRDFPLLSFPLCVSENSNTSLRKKIISMTRLSSSFLFYSVTNAFYALKITGLRELRSQCTIIGSKIQFL